MPSENTFCSQLAELNSRSRWYSTQNWHLPFAYIGVSSVLVGMIADKIPAILPWASLFAGILGIFTLAHMCTIQDGIKRAVSAIQFVESELKIKQTAQYKAFVHLFPMMSIVVLGIAAHFIMSWASFSGNIIIQQIAAK